MASTYLDNIVAWHRERAGADHRVWQDRLESVHYSGPSMSQALRAGTRVKVIAEVKRRSPSKGWIDEHLDPASLARDYEQGGAAALSVLTDEPHFSGSRHDLEVVRAAVEIPILRKDFTVSANDVLDAAEMGASTVLLIVAVLERAELANYIALASECGIDALVEVHDADEASIALDLGAVLIGVNQRDLRSFEVNSTHAANVIAGIDAGVLTVAESGMTSRADVERAAAAGFDAVLVGEAFVRAADPVALVHSFTTVEKVERV
jgi:indole-3-glycerol phosphate synthase